MRKTQLADAVTSAWCGLPLKHVELIEAAQEWSNLGAVHTGLSGERREIDRVGLAGVAERCIDARGPEAPRLAARGELAIREPFARGAEPFPELACVGDAARRAMRGTSSLAVHFKRPPWSMCNDGTPGELDHENSRGYASMMCSA